MARVKRALNAQKKRRTVLKASKGYRGQRSRLYRKAKEQQLHSLTYAYRDRKARKGDFRKLWITRINAAARANGITYNRLIQGSKLAGVEVDRKNLSEIADQRPGRVHRTGRGRQGRAARRRQRAVGRGRLSRTAHRDVRPAWSRQSSCCVHVGRRHAARFLAEGANLVEAALRRGLVDEVFVTEAAHERFGDLLARRPRFTLVTDKAAKALSDTVTPVGLVAVCRMPDASPGRRAVGAATGGRRRRDRPNPAMPAR